MAETEKLRDLKVDEIKERLIEALDNAKKIGMSDEEIMKVVKNRR